MRLGIDVGGVIIDRVNDDTDTSFFSDNYLASKPTVGCFESIRSLVGLFGPENVYIISKCGQKTQAKTLEWLEHNKFWAFTGMLPENIRFCKTREGKAPICKELGITHFVDDRLEVLSYLESVRRLYLFNPNTQEVAKWAHVGRWSPFSGVTTVSNWNDAVDLVSADFLRETC